MKIKLTDEEYREKLGTTCDECKKKFTDGVSCFNTFCDYFGESESVLKWNAIRHEQDEQNDIKAGKY